MLCATRTAATLATGLSPPAATSSSPLPQDGCAGDGVEADAEGQASEAPAAGAPACTAHVQRETWAGRVLRSRGVKGSEHARSSAVYSHILKSLRTKASKLRKRLAVEACVDADGPYHRSCDLAAVSCENDTDITPASAPAECPPVTEAACTSEATVLQQYSRVAQVRLGSPLPARLQQFMVATPSWPRY